MTNQKQYEWTVRFSADIYVTASNKSEAQEQAKALFRSWIEEDADASDFDAYPATIMDSLERGN